MKRDIPMPTENRSSNTEMVSDKLPPCADDVFKNGVSACLVGDVPKHAAETICQSLSAVTGWKIDWHYFGGRTHIKALAPAPQPHPEPIAWMVGTAFWWTKEEAERDAAATGLPVVPVGPMVDTAEVERLRTENIRLIEDRARFPDRPDDIGIMIGCHIGNLKNQAKSSEDYARKWRWKLEAAERKLAEHDALLIEVLPSLDLAAGAFKSAKPVRNKVKAAISASAEPEVT
ncbi:hypothetical protein [Pseudomonas juntendi]|uniref:hypothetical protein n=1 Tax=Pseudomonas juntendi TaxID=2666183 RepID=UPI00244AB827|nr:hypothetical protein [Pseudomonas juntendi]MDH1552624.1 hypothetical protein [Pseudomonas juntendi]